MYRPRVTTESLLIKKTNKQTKTKQNKSKKQHIKYFQIILNNDFLLLSCQNLNCSKSCQLATFGLPIGNFDQNLLNFDRSNLRFFTEMLPIGNSKVANWQPFEQFKFLARQK